MQLISERIRPRLQSRVDLAALPECRALSVSLSASPTALKVLTQRP